MDIDDFQKILEVITEEIPEELFRELNGGVIVLPEFKLHPESQNPCLYTMGEYRTQVPGLGRYIVIYYGSFMRVFGAGADPQRIRRELRKTLRHEFRHHIETLAGAKDLLIEDKLNLLKYRRSAGSKKDQT